jgi:hypothetical protein
VTAPTGIHHPVVVIQNRQRFEDFQLRIADRVTAFAGSLASPPAEDPGRSPMGVS